VVGANAATATTAAAGAAVGRQRLIYLCKIMLMKMISSPLRKMLQDRAIHRMAIAHRAIHHDGVI
jgi:hypothetical protein